MNADAAQWLATSAIAVFGSAAFWGYWKDRRKSRAAGAVAAATVEVQVDSQRLSGLEQRFAFAQRAWDQERESLHRQIDLVKDELAEEKRERAEERREHEGQVRQLEERIGGITRELADVTHELAALRQSRAT